MNDEYLPGFRAAKPKLSEKEEESRFYDLLDERMDKIEKRNLFLPGGFKNDIEKLKEVRKFAKSYQLELPTSIKRQLRQWAGQDRYKQIKKTKGSKYAISLIEEIQQVIPLSLKGFDFSFGKSSVKWKRESDNKEFTLFLPLDKAGIMKPAAGDLAKRVIMATFRFAVARRTVDPGPITFKQFLDILGEKRASQEKRERIKDICESCAHTSLEVRRVHDKKRGQEGYFRYTPFFKDYIWKGGFGFDSIIYPVINERFGRMLVEEDLSRYIWFADERLKRLPKGMTDRDRLAQDQFKMIMGLPVIRFIMKNWLYKFGQFTDKEILNWKLEDIKEFVNKNIDLAKEGGLLERVKIHIFQKKENYLKQVIFLYPIKSKWPARKRIILTARERAELEGLTDWLYEIGQEDYSDIDLKTVRQYLLNMAEYGHLDCLEAAYNVVENYSERDYPVGEEGEYQNRPMLFWTAYRNCVEKKRPKK